ncbi:hypothetical protein Cgig2_002537 [Carnegiea gigantea]|uniref:C2H2-type domain-containing protein n=1 Tax=Carnegiea gigantea TaxID=171969 RepID=A0A9Q1KT80_9CARY|nr:hypothetical protein Cgig2_002537 [Carnegiea gigantea]
MYLCRICNKQVVGDDRAPCMHMRTHDIQITATTSPTGTYYHHDKVKGDNEKHKSSNGGDRLASSLVLLSNGSLKPFALLMKAGSQVSVDDIQAKQPVEKPFLDQAVHGGNKEGEKDLADGDDKANEVVRGTFECRACNKIFYSHQALGGHRASHKKIKGCFAAAYLNPGEKRVTESRDQNLVSSKRGESLDLDPSRLSSKGVMLHGSLSNNTTSKKKSKSHECSICHRVFPSGQALGGHKRCHWLPSSVSSDTPFHSGSTFHNFLDEGNPLYKKAKFGTSKPLDLNQVPLPFDELYKAPNDKIRIDVESHIHGLRTSVTTNLLGDRGIRRDINSIYHSWFQYNNSTNENHFVKEKNADIIDANAKARVMSIGLNDSNVDGLRSSITLVKIKNLLLANEKLAVKDHIIRKFRRYFDPPVSNFIFYLKL